MASNERLTENTDRAPDALFMGFRGIVSCETQFTKGRKR